ncbi:MAG: XisI protein [Caldilineaceae bacterium]
MDRITKYRTIVKDLLQCQAEHMQRHPQPVIETELSFDEVHDNYLLLNVGWTKQGRMLVPALYIRLHNGKIWVENDWTEAKIVDALVERGVPTEDIVLAFHPPNMRQYTEFAVA